MMKKYDGLYIFAGQAKDDVLEGQIAKAVAEVTRLGGNILSQEVLGKRAFARPMRKRESGVYVQVRFELDPPSKVSELVNRYRLVEEVFRVQILAVDDRREAVLAAQREAAEQRAAAKAQKEAEAAEAAPAE